jgi:hypothetical protein
MTQPSDLLHFYAFYGSGDLSFAVPISVARAMEASMSGELAKRGADRAAALEDAARSIEDAFRNGRHEDPVAVKQVSKLILLTCLMSREAGESPDARGFLMEINQAEFPSWSADTSIRVNNSKSMPPIKTHYGLVAGKAEIDAIMLARRAKAATERT